MPNWRRRYKHYRRWLALSRLRCRRLATISTRLYSGGELLVRRFARMWLLAGKTNVWATGTADAGLLRDTADPVAEGQAIARIYS